jgi:hypothetical protein
MLAYYELAYKNNKLAYLKIKWRFCVIVHAPLFVNAAPEKSRQYCGNGRR